MKPQLLFQKQIRNVSVKVVTRFSVSWTDLNA